MSEKSTKPQSDPTSSAEGSPARTFPLPEREPDLPESGAGSGLSLPGSFASYDPDSLSWKTYQHCLDGGLETYSETWPRAGTMRDGTAYLHKPLAPLTGVTGSSLSRGEYPTPSGTEWATPSAASATGGQRSRSGKLRGELLLGGQAIGATSWPTPTSSDSKSSGSKGYNGNEFMTLTDATVRDGRQDPTTCTHGGECKPTLNPRFVEWLMGFPVGWTDLDR